MFATISPGRIPEYDALSQSSLPGGRCLDHYHVLTSLSDETKYFLCMGPVKGNKLHCWLENDWLLVDFTLSKKFFDRGEYYHVFEIDADQLKRYSLFDAICKAASGVTFWDFDVSKYHVVQP